MSLATQVGPETVVSLVYTLYGEDGEIIDQTDESSPLTYVHGYGQILPGLESAIEGLVAGDSKSVTLSPEQGYGPYDDAAVLEVELSEFPDPVNVKPDDEFVAESAAGETLSFRVIEVRDDGVLIDGNHPLAGEALRFDVRIVSARPATDAEIAEAEEKLEETLSPEDDQEAQPAVSPERLLQLGRKPINRHGPS